MLLRFRLPYRAPRELLQGLQAGTKLSSPLTPSWSFGQRSTSTKWSAVVASLLLHQWHSGFYFSSRRLFVLYCDWLRAVWFSVRFVSWLWLWVCLRLGIRRFAC